MVDSQYTELLTRLNFIINHLEQDLRLLRELSQSIVSIRLRSSPAEKMYFEDRVKDDDRVGNPPQASGL
jgi:hypothetical protein